MEEDIREKIRIAKQAVEDEPEPFKIEAFKIILTNLLDTKKSGYVKNAPKRSNRSSSNRKNNPNSLIEIDNKLLEKIDVNKLNHISSLKSVLDKSLSLLYYVKENIRDYKGLTIDEIKRILSDKFGLTQITSENISMQLKNVTGKYVTRTKFSNNTVKFQYEILEEGMTYITKIIRENEKTDSTN